MAVTAITSLTTRDVQVVRDATALGASVSFSPFGAPEAGYTLDIPLIDETTATGLTQELRVASDTERVAWVLGAFYSTAEREYVPERAGGGLCSRQQRCGLRFLAGRNREPGSRLVGITDPGEPPRHGRALFLRSHLRLQSARAVRGGLSWYDFDAAHPDVRPVCRSVDSDGATTAAGVAPRVIASYAMFHLKSRTHDPLTRYFAATSAAFIPASLSSSTRSRRSIE